MLFINGEVESERSQKTKTEDVCLSCTMVGLRRNSQVHVLVALCSKVKHHHLWMTSFEGAA